MTRPQIISGPHQLPGVDGMRSRTAWAKLAKKLARSIPDTAKVGIRQGVVTAVSSVAPGQTPTYTVTVGGVSVTATCIGTCGPLPGDTVMIIRQGPDWMILGLAPASAGLKPWTPQLLATATNPTIGTGSAVGWYRMVGPTTMWLNFDITADSSIGSGSYQIGGLPLSVVFDETLPIMFMPMVGGALTRWPGIGHIQVTAPTLITRIGIGYDGTRVNSGASSTGPTNQSTPLRVAGTGTLEVDPSGF
jgi:hypothetical protein